MSVLFSLPDDLSRCVSSDWLTVKSLGAMDCAVCSKKWRIQYLQLLQSLKDITNDVGGLQFVEWTVARNILIHRIILEDGMFDTKWMAAYPIQWQCVQHLEVPKNIDEKDITACINACISLTSLTFSVGDVNFSSISIGILSNLVSVTLFYFVSETVDAMTAIAENCHKLKSFTIEYDSATFGANKLLLMNIFESNPQLEEVCLLTYDDDVMAIVENCCKSLTKIMLYGNVDMSTTTRLWKNYKGRKHLRAFGDLYQIDVNVFEDSIEITTWDTMMPEWNELLNGLPAMKWVTLRVYSEASLDTFRLYLDRNNRIYDLSIYSSEIPHELIGSIVNRCATTLRLLYLSCQDTIGLSGALTDNNRLEKLDLNYWGVEWELVLDKCHHLKSFRFSDIIDIKDVGALMDAVEKYKNCATGESLSFDCNVCIDQNDSDEFQLYFDGAFSGTLWEEYQKVYGLNRLKIN